MFSFKKSRVVIFSLVVVFIAAFVTSCKEPEPALVSYNIQGNWDSSWSEIYNITETTFDTGDTAWSYAGDNLVIEPLTNNSGYLYFKYTKALCDTHSDKSDPDMKKWVYVYDADAADVGKWYAVYYKDLTETSVQISGAYGLVTSTETLEEAKKVFTVENGYYKRFSECVRK